MCGIAGIAGRRDAALLREMTAALAHRGPDDEGFFLGDGVSLGHRRLSVIDLAAGHQPMSHADGRCQIVFNGEIYNYRELRETLLGLGHEFHTSGDTEVILAAWAEWGDACLGRLEGMFAFALWDTATQSLFLARDPVGIKPLYYAEVDGVLYFASEMKSLFLCPGVDMEMDMESLDDYLTWLHTVPPRTFHRGISQLPPGHCGTWSAGRGLRARRYWCLAERAARRDLPPGEWVEALREHLDRLLDRHLLADVPLGALLSGGIDSAALAALMKGLGVRPSTFTVGYGAEAAAFDETAEAREVAEHLGTLHHELRVSPGGGDFLETLLHHFDEPYGNPMALLSHAVFRMVREHVTVVLSGDGGDECFGGYPRYSGLQFARWMRWVPGPLHRGLVLPLARRIPENTAGNHWPRRVRSFLETDPHDPMGQYARWLSRLTPAMKADLYTEGFRRVLAGRDAWEPIRRLARESGSANPVEQAMYADMHHFLPHNVLHCADRMSMAHGLEARVPFADQTLLEFMTAVPPELKVRGRATKILLRRVMEKELPAATLQRPKRGFEPPRGGWMATKLRDEMETLLSPATLKADGLFAPAAVRRLLDEHNAGQRDHTLPLWALLVFQYWRHRR